MNGTRIEPFLQLTGVAMKALAVLMVVVLGGCAGTLDKAVNTCFALDGSPSFTRAEGVEKFDCQRAGVVSARAR